jgi:7-keto-8-aminopelargonate synthetase-like enzyme
MVRYLVNRARPLIFSTAPSPPSVAGALAALELLAAEPGRVRALHDAARTLREALVREGFAVMASDMHIVPLIVGESGAAMLLCEAALERGVFAQAIRPPTVAEGTSRLRLAVMASHSAGELEHAAGALADAVREVGLDPARLGEPAVASGRRLARVA